MFGEDHGCVEFTTQQDVLNVVRKKQTCVGKITINLYFYEVAKTKPVRLLSNTYQIKGVWKKTHMFVKKQTCLSFPIQVTLLFVFAHVFEFFIIDIINYIYIYHFRGAHAISDVKNAFKTAFEKITCLGIPTHVWENPHT